MEDVKARLLRWVRCDRGAISMEFVVLTAGAVLLCASVFTSLVPGGGLNASVDSLVETLTDKMAEADFSD